MAIRPCVPPRWLDLGKAFELLPAWELRCDGSQVHYGAPTADSRVHPSKDLKQLHPGAPFFYAFNVDPGSHEIVTSVGTAMVKTKLRARASVVTYVTVTFDGKPFPQDPTPPLCLVDWPAAGDTGK